MDLNKIFLKDACPTKMGGQAVMEGIMMKGEEKTALAVRLPDGRIRIRTTANGKPRKWMTWPMIRGVVAFFVSLVQGTKILMDSADILEEYDDEEYEESRFEKWLNGKFGSRAAWNFMLYSSVIIALVLAVGLFIILPTWVVNLMKHFTDSVFWLNFVEGILRIAMFVGYVWLASMTPDIKTVFRYHGAEHKTIHCFENGQELTPANCRQFPRLHPRCGTSFLMFVFLIAFVLHFLLGWPVLWLRITIRILLLPVIAGLSYELLKWAGRSDNLVVKILSLPGLYLQKITTKEPTDKQLEVAIASIRAVRDDTPAREYILRADGTEETPEDEAGAAENENAPAIEQEAGAAEQEPAGPAENEGDEGTNIDENETAD